MRLVLVLTLWLVFACILWVVERIESVVEAL